MSIIVQEKMYFNGKIVIEIFKYSERRNVYWDNMPFRLHDLVNHREHGPCLIWKIISRGPNEGQLELATLKGMQRFHHGGAWNNGTFRAEINEVDEIKFNNKEEYTKYFQLNVEPYPSKNWDKQNDEWFKKRKVA